jgi:hypothetical protein
MTDLIPDHYHRESWQVPIIGVLQMKTNPISLRQRNPHINHQITQDSIRTLTMSPQASTLSNLNLGSSLVDMTAQMIRVTIVCSLISETCQKCLVCQDGPSRAGMYMVLFASMLYLRFSCSISSVFHNCQAQYRFLSLFCCLISNISTYPHVNVVLTETIHHLVQICHTSTKYVTTVWVAILSSHQRFSTVSFLC